MDPIAEAYSSAQNGGELPYFVGGGKQHGAGWLRTLARIAFPILKRLVGVATNTAEDVIMRDKKLLSSLKDNSMNEVGRLMAGKGAEAAATSINRTKKRKANTDGTIFATRGRRK